MNGQESYLSRTSVSFFYSNLSSFLSTKHHHLFIQIMQAIESYTPSSPNLHLTPFQSINTVTDDVNPLHYHLTVDDFITLTLPTGQLLYALDPATGTSLWWALRCITRIITRAAIHSIPTNSYVPVAQRAYIPQFQFDHIAMQRPAILSTLNPDCMNPLYGYTSRENIQGWFTDFQNMGRQAVQWIRTARYQSAYLGPYSGWNWEAPSQDVARLELPNRYLIKGPDGTQFRIIFLLILTEILAHADYNAYTLPSTYSSSASDSFSEVDSLTSDEDIIMEDTDYGKQPNYQLKFLELRNWSGNRSLILHPVLSAYAKHYTDYNVFSKELLVNNGYVEQGARDLTPYASALSPINSTTFPILSLPEVDVRDD